MQPNVTDLWYFKISIMVHKIIKVWNITGWKDAGIRKHEFVAKKSVSFLIPISLPPDGVNLCFQT